jgi:hypothetical protein
MPYTLDIIPEFINPIVNNKYPRLTLKTGRLGEGEHHGP